VHEAAAGSELCAGAFDDTETVANAAAMMKDRRTFFLRVATLRMVSRTSE
jgi:hypothetical protein